MELITQYDYENKKRGDTKNIINDLLKGNVGENVKDVLKEVKGKTSHIEDESIDSEEIKNKKVKDYSHYSYDEELAKK
jgi:hypothetical protein